MQDNHNVIHGDTVKEIHTNLFGSLVYLKNCFDNSTIILVHFNDYGEIIYCSVNGFPADINFMVNWLDDNINHVELLDELCIWNSEI